MNPCLPKIKAYARQQGLKISEKYLDGMSRILESERADSLTNAEFMTRSDELIAQYTQHQMEKVKAANGMIIEQRERDLRRIVDDKSAPTWERLRNLIQGGAIKKGMGTNIEPKNVRDAILSDLEFRWARAIEPFKEHIQSGSLDFEIYQELEAVERTLPAGKSGSKVAAEVAKVIYGHQNAVFDLIKAYNPFIEKIDDYRTKQFHDREKVSDATKEYWVKSVYERLSDKAFNGLSEKEKVAELGDIYERIRDGSYGDVTDQSASDKFITVNGSGVNIQKAMARQRSIVFRDAKAAYEYNTEFGLGTLTENISQLNRSTSRNVALMQKFTANPRGYYEGMYKRLMGHPEVSAEDKALLRDKKDFLDRAFKAVLEPQNVPSHGNINRAAEGMMSLQVAGKLGSTVIKAGLMDPIEAASLLSNLNGKSVTMNAAKVAVNYARAAKLHLTDPKQFEQFMNSMLLHSSSVVGRINNDLGHEAPSRAPFAKLASLTTKISGLHAHDEIMRLAVGTAVADHLGSQSVMSYKELAPEFKTGLKSYGFGEHEWNLVRQGAQDYTGLSGKSTMLDATGISTLSDDHVADYLTRSGKVLIDQEPTTAQIDRARKDMEYQFGAMINEHADASTARPNTRQRLFMYRDFKTNEGFGLALRLFWQMRGASLASMDVTRRLWNSGDGTRGNWAGVSERVGLGLAAATTAYMLYNLKEGKTPPDPTTPESMLEITKMSGMTTLLGDTLLSMVPKAYHRRVGDALESGSEELLGPGLSTFLKAGGVAAGEAASAAGATSGQFDKSLRATEARTLIGMIPLQNLWYGQAAFNHYLFNGLREFANPGTLGRQEQRTANTPGLLDDSQRYFMMKPTESTQWGP